MGINSVDSDHSGASEQPGQADGRARQDALASISLRCVECSALYPGFETAPRYRCECGGLLDVEIPFLLPAQLASSSHTTVPAEGDMTPLAGAAWRQLFDE